MKYLLLVVVGILGLSLCESVYYNFTLSKNEAEIILGQEIEIDIEIGRYSFSDCQKEVEFSTTGFLPDRIIVTFEPTKMLGEVAKMKIFAKADTKLEEGRYPITIIMTNPYKGKLFPESQEFILNVKNKAL